MPPRLQRPAKSPPSTRIRTPADRGIDRDRRARNNDCVEPLPVLLLGCIAGLGFSLSGLLSAAGNKRASRRKGGKDGRADANKDAADAKNAKERGLYELRAGDIVQHGSAYLTVRRALALGAAGSWQLLGELAADGDSAARALLIGGGEAGTGAADAAWLLTALPEPHPELLTSAHAPASESFAHDGLRYRLISRHHTAVRLLTAAPAPAFPVGDAEPNLSLCCYRGPGARRLLVLRWRADASARLYVGELVLFESLSVLAGS